VSLVGLAVGAQEDVFPPPLCEQIAVTPVQLSLPDIEYVLGGGIADDAALV